MRTISVENEMLPVDLTDSEKIDFGRRLAELGYEISGIEERKASIAKQLGEDIKALEQQANTVGACIRSGTERREIPVETQADDERCEIIKLRIDTGEILSRRAMTPEERQVSMFRDDQPRRREQG